MTMYLVFEALQRGQNQQNLPQFQFSRARSPSNLPQKLYLKAGQTISVDKALQAIAVKSANDVAYADGGVFKRLGSSLCAAYDEPGARARYEIKPRSGILPVCPTNARSQTARDMAKLGIALRRRFPQYYSYFSRRSFVFNGRHHPRPQQSVEPVARR